MLLARQVVEGMRWIGAQTSDPDATRRAWARGRAVPVPAGRAFAVVRLPEPLGRAAVRALLDSDHSLVGPALVNHTEDVVEIFVPITPAVWQGPNAELIDGSRASSRMIKIPPPSRRADGREWLCPPRALPGCSAVLTDPYRLAEVVAVARNALLAGGYRLGP
ncbi:hypothetical protein [Kitasatospora sp. NPDC089509]|uniref:hypothetical protein n=1 Tax=Kitasatospora sp. NPDC089509 TaxID=3364079 RepID=UPI003812BA48